MHEPEGQQIPSLTIAKICGALLETIKDKGSIQSLLDLTVMAEVIHSLSGSDGFIFKFPFSIFPDLVLITTAQEAKKLASLYEFGESKKKEVAAVSSEKGGIQKGTLLHKALALLKRSFIVDETSKEVWFAHRRAANPEYAPKRIKDASMLIDETAQGALEYLERWEEVPSNWIEIMVTSMTTQLLVGEPLNPEVLEPAVLSRKSYTKSIITAIMTGITPSLARFLVGSKLDPYYQLIMTMKESCVQRNTSSEESHTHAILDHVLEKLIDTGQLNETSELKIEHVIAGLLAGISPLSVSITNLLLHLGQNPEEQTRIRGGDSEYLSSIIKKVGTEYPPLPITIRRATRTLSEGNYTIKDRSLLVNAIFAYKERDFSATFGEAPRVCLGKFMAVGMMEAFIMAFLSRFTIQLPENRYYEKTGTYIQNSTNKPRLGGITLKLPKTELLLISEGSEKKVTISY